MGRNSRNILKTLKIDFFNKVLIGLKKEVSMIMLVFGFQSLRQIYL